MRLGETLAMGVEPGGRARVARARAQPERHRRQLRAVSARTAGRLVVDLPEHGLPRAVRHQRDVRAGGGDPPPPAAHARGRGADLGAPGRRRVQGLQAPGRRRAAAPRHPAVRGAQDQARARARLGPPQGAATRSRSRTRPTRRSPSRSTPRIRTTSSKVELHARDARGPGRQDRSTSKMVVSPPRQKWIGRPEEKRLPSTPARARRRWPGEGRRRRAAGRGGARAGSTTRRARAPPPKARRRCSSALGGAGAARQRRPAAACRSPARAPRRRRASRARTSSSRSSRSPGGGAPRAQHPAAAQPGRLPPEGVAAVVDHDAAAAADPAGGAAVPAAARATSSSPRSRARSRRSRPRRSSSRPTSSSPPRRRRRSAPRRRPAPSSGRRPRPARRRRRTPRSRSLIAVGNGKVQVPSVVGQTQAEAEKTLREKKLTIGQLQPQPPDPKAKISSQIPAADEVVTEGKPIDIFMATIKDKKKKGGDEEDEGGGGGGGGKAAAVDAARAGRQPVAEAAQKAADAGLVPEKVTEFSGKKKGELIRTEPARGHQARGGREGQAASSPAASRSWRTTTARTCCSSTAPTASAPPRSPRARRSETDPTFSRRRHEGRLRRQPARVRQGPARSPTRRRSALTDGGREVQRPGVGADGRPQRARDVHATRARRATTPTRTSACCRSPRTQPPPQCINEPGFNVRQDRPLGARRQVDLRARHQAAADRVRHRALEVEEGVLARRQGLGQGQVRAPTSRRPARACIDVAISPDGKRWPRSPTSTADAFQLYLGKPKDFLLTDAKPQGVRACKVAWRSDGQEVVVVQADELLPARPTASSCACRSTNPRGQQQIWASRRQPRLPAADAGVARALHELPSPALARGRATAAHCGTPVAGAAAPLELVLADETRVPLVGDMTIGRAPGSTRRARRPERLARARAHLARRQRRRRS